MVISKWNWVDATVFLADREGVRIGTGFLIHMKNPIDENPLSQWMVEGSFVYLVSAYHVVHDVEDTFALLRARDGSVRSVPVAKWQTHPSRQHETDVVVGQLDLSDLEGPIRTIYSGYCHTRRTEPLVLGQDVFYAGLLTHVPSMADRAIPMVRAGKLGAWDQPGIPFRPAWLGEDEPTMMIRGHLIDSYGYYGFSGSPVFVTSPNRTSLLGVLIGFFDYRIRTEMGGGWELPVNAGVAIVAPAWDVTEILNSVALVEDRKMRGRVLKTRKK